MLKTALRSSLCSLTALQPQGNAQMLAPAATALILCQTLDVPHVAALKARSHRSFPKHPSLVHASQESSSIALTMPCTEDPQQTRCLLKYLLKLQVLVGRSCVRRPLPRREKPSRPWVQTTSRLTQHSSKQSYGSPSRLQEEFFVSCSTPVKCSPCPFAGPQEVQHSCSSSPSHDSTGFVCSRRKAVSEKVLRLSAILPIVIGQIYPTNLPDQTSAILRGVQVQVCTEWKEPAATKFSKGNNSLCDVLQDLWEQRDKKIQTIASAAQYPSAFPLTEAGEAGNRAHKRRTEQKHSSCKIWDSLQQLVEGF